MASPFDFLSHPEPTARPTRRWPSWLLPAAILGGFALVFLGLYRDRILPAPTVQVAPVLVVSETASRPSGDPTAKGSPLFQASGWVEPDPYAVKASALVDGVVKSVHVLEGEDVEEGQLLVTLIDDDARLALAAAEGQHRLLISSRSAHLAATEAMGKKSEAAQAEATAAQTMEAEAGDQLARQDRLTKASVVSQSDFTTARLRLQREQSLHLAAQAREGEFAAEVQRMRHEAEAKNDEIALAAVAVEQARLALARTRILSPIKGRVLRLTAAPGDKKMLGMDHPDSSTVCVLYDPAHLQVRVDVPLADAALLQVGQSARVHTSLLNDTVFDGTVSRITGEADLQRNTLQAKVRIQDPADQLRPEMLCRVEFLSSATAHSTTPGATLTTWIPSSALQGDTVWVCDPESRRLTKRTVQATPEKRDDHIRITEGVSPGEQVVLSPGSLRDGQRVHPILSQP
jgi:HlyD family secretion protein